MDPRHRDRVAYMRICSGRYERDMEVWHARMKRTVRLAPPLRIFGQEREVIDEAYAGDVIGVINPAAIFDVVTGASSSITSTLAPACSSCHASVVPASPWPTMMTSQIRLGVLVVAGVSAAAVIALPLRSRRQSALSRKF